MKKSMNQHPRTAALVQSVTPQFRVRYSTNTPQVNWELKAPDKPAINAFFERQEQLHTEISHALSENKASDCLSALFSEYLSNPFDLFGYSVSTAAILGLQQKEPGSASNEGIEKQLGAATGAKFVRIGTQSTSDIVVNAIQAARRAKPGRELAISWGKPHVSFWNAVIAADYKVRQLEGSTDKKTGVQKLPSQKKLIKNIRKHRKQCGLVFVTMPNYFGGAIDLQRICAECRKQDVMLIVDGAWSSIWSQHPSFPESYARCCDALLISLHKSGLAPCQVSAALFNNERLVRAFDELGLLGEVTTTPNQVLLAATESRVQNLLSGKSFFDWVEAIEACETLRDSLPDIHPQLKHISCKQLNAEFVNPNQLILDGSDISVDCRVWAKQLSEEFSRDVEMATHGTLNIIFAPGNCNDVAALADDLRDSLSSAMDQYSHSDKRLSHTDLPKIGSKIIHPREAFYRHTKLVPLADAVGSVASSLITITPPCQKIFVYGETVQAAHVDLIENAMRADLCISGLEWVDNHPHVRIVDNGDVSIETVKTPIENASLALELAEFLTGGWAGPPYHHAFIHEDEPLTSLSPAQYLNRINNTDEHCGREWYSWADLKEMPVKPGYHRVIDVENYSILLQDQLELTGYLTLVRDQDAQLLGVLHCLCGEKIEDLVEVMEWLHANMLCATLDPVTGNTERFYEKLRYHFNLSPKHKVCTISAQILHPSIRGGDVFRQMMQDIARNISAAHARLPLLCELSDEGTTARTVNEAAMDRVIYDVLPRENGHCVGFSQRTSNALYYYEADKKHWNYAVAQQTLKENRPYFPHPEDHPNLEVRETEDGRGLGVFATGEGIQKGEIIARFDGERYRSELASKLHDEMVDHAIQVSQDEYVFGRFGLAQLLNSSHEPNAGLLGNTTLIAIKSIEANEEVLWSYEMSEWSDWRHEPCNCGSDNCPGFIGTIEDLPHDVQKKYIEEEIAADWVIEEFLNRNW